MTAPLLPLDPGLVLPLHFGGLHPYETALALFVAFAPFVGLGVVIVVRRRQDAAEEAAQAATAPPVVGSLSVEPSTQDLPVDGPSSPG
jgi:hypothetical protein